MCSQPDGGILYAEILSFPLSYLVYNLKQHYLLESIRDLPPLNDKAYVQRFYADTKVKPFCLPPVRGMKKRVLYWVRVNNTVFFEINVILTFWTNNVKLFLTKIRSF